MPFPFKLTSSCGIVDIFPIPSYFSSLYISLYIYLISSHSTFWVRISTPSFADSIPTLRYAEWCRSQCIFGWYGIIVRGRFSHQLHVHRPSTNL
ncbi:hypothetical protein PILCRDRAFT_200977 [Piloderma croceum F 1598]|uniref:Uncharacterized protein n=1 Tax=Piloderma croceum (strain F 1598) TaxID=765440 RepID=A0A0C3G0Z8_PILCF|nr:hypothetical protein PILCRDRAFT_200977 [Piloderma croceum F 1598]